MITTSTVKPGVLLKLRAIVVPSGQNQKHFAHTLEIWQQRALLICPVSLPSNVPCQLFLEIPLNDAKTKFETVEIASTIQFSVLIGQLGQYRIGVKFITMPAAAENSLQRILR